MSSIRTDYQSVPVEIRPITPKARRRSWGEPAVRTWWMLALLLMLITAWILAEQWTVIRSGRWRIEHWHRIPEAHIDKINDEARDTYRPSLEQLAIVDSTLSYVSADGKTHVVKGKLKAQKKPVRPAETIPILVNPQNPDDWTDRVSVAPLMQELLVPLLLLPLPVLCLLMALWQRQRILKLWRTGAKRQATVVDTGQSAAHPRSMIVRCTLTDSRDKRILSVVIPRSAARLKPGDSLVIITPIGEPSRAVAAMLYE